MLQRLSAALVKFKHSFLSNAMFRTLQDKLGDNGISIKDCGAKCDGVTDDTAAWKEAIRFSELYDLPILIPSGKTVISEELVFTRPPQIRGAKYSPPVIGKFQGVPYEHTGTIILSKVPAGRSITINPPSNNKYIRGCWLEDFHLLSDEATGRNGSGMLIANCGWGGYVRGVVVEGFLKGGVELSQMQDTQFDQLEILDCGTDGVVPALDITNGSNLLTFIRLRVEGNGFQMRVIKSQMLDFVAPHFEQGDYPGASFPELEHINRSPSIMFTASHNVKITGGFIFGATLSKQIAQHGLTAAQCPFHMSVGGDCSNISYYGVTMGFGYDSGRILEHHGSGHIIGCTFTALCTETYPLILDGNIQFKDNNCSYTDNPNNEVFTLMAANYATIEGNLFACVNPDSVAKHYGSLFTLTANKPIRLGMNQYIINKRPRFFDNPVILISNSHEGQEQSAGGVVNMQQYNPASMIALYGGVGGASPVTSIDNMNQNQRVTFTNNGTGNAQFVHGGNVSLSGGVNAELPPGGFIEFIYNGNTGVNIEIARSF